MLKKITFIGANYFLSCGILHIARTLQHYIPKKYSAIIFIDLSSCHHNIGKKLVIDNNALIILLMDDKKDSRLFQIPDVLYHIAYVVANSTCCKLYSDLKSIFINSGKLICPLYEDKYKRLFSNREEIIIELMMNNYSIASISFAMSIPIKTIYNCRAYIMRKLNANNSVEMYNKIQQIYIVNNLLNIN
ncbi:LuxR C-terminal-related transcriptional regulator [Citrobacter portucalensis]|uniref:LuxR C-terminal-related transcriptional regulator n=1 Tax=Citrobacter portucalensis TaxID=1639133 RepID=A0AAW5WDF5_9ENTR|nr:LuxR C-terminal-related transcriptional regulator [Citrobacter portucalensis]MCX9004407.1 LuxR C-terminal-related transcriptional regulator [Citrobacter portucalensis]